MEDDLMWRWLGHYYNGEKEKEKEKEDENEEDEGEEAEGGGCIYCLGAESMGRQ